MRQVHVIDAVSKTKRLFKKTFILTRPGRAKKSVPTNGVLNNLEGANLQRVTVVLVMLPIAVKNGAAFGNRKQVQTP